MLLLGSFRARPPPSTQPDDDPPRAVSDDCGVSKEWGQRQLQHEHSRSHSNSSSPMKQLFNHSFRRRNCCSLQLKTPRKLWLLGIYRSFVDITEYRQGGWDLRAPFVYQIYGMKSKQLKLVITYEHKNSAFNEFENCAK